MIDWLHLIDRHRIDAHARTLDSVSSQTGEDAGSTEMTFDRYIGIDYSGAQTPTQSLKGLRVFAATHDSLPVEVAPPPSPRKYGTRRGLAEWLAATLSDNARALVGIDHAFSFPLRYFEVHHLLPDWTVFLEDFQRHWPTDGEHTYVDFVRNGSRGSGAARSGNSRWRRLTEERAGAKSVFHFDAPGSVAKATHAGLPWLRYLRQRLRTGSGAGRSTAGGTSPTTARVWSRSTRPCGTGGFRERNAAPTSTTPGLSPSGCGEPTAQEA